MTSSGDDAALPRPPAPPHPGGDPGAHSPGWLLPAILAGIVVGIASGFAAPEFSARYLSLFGEIFLRLLKMIIVPLIVASMIAGVGFLGDIRRIGRLGSVTIAYFLTTTFIAVIVGITLVEIVQPGIGYPVDPEMAKQVAAEKLARRGDYSMAQALYDILMGFFSTNIVKSMVEMEIMPLIVFSLILGAILTTFEGGKRLLRFFDDFNEAILRFVRFVMLFAPVGIMGLVASKLGEAQLKGEFMAAMNALFAYALTVISGLLIHGLIVLPLVLYFVAKRNPLPFIRGLGRPLATAFGTSSSSATLPVTMQCLEDEAKISKRTAGFVPPIGATINMDGTALYEAVAAIFIAQAYGIELAGPQLVVVFLTATLASIGAAGIPEAGLVTMILVLKAVGLPIEGIGLILAIDWFLDRCRTTVNVWGDCIGAAVVERLVPPEGAGPLAETEKS